MIRDTRPSDLEKIFKLVHSSFSRSTEPDLIKQLISDGDVIVNLVFESGDTIIGNVVVSKVTMEPDRGLFCGGIGPLSVCPNRQSSGIGSRLIKEVIGKSKKLGMDALFLLGDPLYYERFGFIVSRLESDYQAEKFQELELTKNSLVNLNSKITYAKAFLRL